MRWFSVASALLFGLMMLFPGNASASFLQTATARDDMASREVDRGLVMGKGWVQLSVGLSWKHSTSGFTAGDGVFNVGEGSSESWRNEGVFDYRLITHKAYWGYTRKAQIYFELPFVAATLRNELLRDDQGNMQPLNSVSLGDVRFGWRYQWVATDKEKFRTFFATDVSAKVPTGNESPGSYLGGPANVQTIISGTGTFDLQVLLGLRQQLSVVALELWGGYVYKPSGVVQWLIETERNQFNARVDPGDAVRLDIALAATLVRPLSLRVDFKNTYRMATRVGTSTRGIPACDGCKTIPNSAGFWSDIRGTVQFWDINFPLGFDLYFEYTLWGRNSMALWPLEDFSPSRGFTAGGNIFARF